MTKTLLCANAALHVVPPVECLIAEYRTRVFGVRVVNNENLLSAEERSKVRVEEMLLLESSRIRRYPKLHRIGLDSKVQPAKAEQTHDNDAREDCDGRELGACACKAAEGTVAVSVENILLCGSVGEAGMVDHVSLILIVACCGIL